MTLLREGQPVVPINPIFIFLYSLYLASSSIYVLAILCYESYKWYRNVKTYYKPKFSFGKFVFSFTVPHLPKDNPIY